MFQVLKRHYARYTPDLVERVCGVPRDLFRQVCELVTENSGRDRTTAFAYAVGWTQHTVGVQNIRAASVLQTLLGNIGRPGGGILELRGHASIQGSTDIPTLFNLLPGYIPMPHAHQNQDLAAFVAAEAARKGYWGNMRAYLVSLLKAYWGDAATPENDFCFDYLPRLTGSHSTYETTMAQLDGVCKGYFLLGENPAVGNADAKLMRLGMANLDWLVVRDFSLIESATWWRDGPETETGELRTEDIRTEVFFLPAAAHTEKDGSFTNTQRLLQWQPPGGRAARRGPQRAVVRLPPGADRPREAGRVHRRDGPAGARPGLGLPDAGPARRAGRGGGPRRDQRPRRRGESALLLRAAEARRLDRPAAAGSTAGCTPTASTRRPAADRAGSRTGWRPSGRGPGRPTGGSCTTAPPRTPRAGRGASARRWCGGTRTRGARGEWTGHDVPDIEKDKAPDHEPPEGATGPQALSGTDPFLMQADGKAWLYVPSGLTDGPLPAHYEPQDSPFPNLLYDQQRNPVRQLLPPHPDNRYQPSGDEPGARVFPYVATTYRLTEHHTAGGMSRWQPYLAELQPEFFCEVSPQLAAERGLTHTGWATIVSARGVVEARVLVTDRMVPLTVHGRPLHQVGLPYHWGPNGRSTGDAANELLHLSLDPNTHIQETKAFAVDIRPGRRPRGRGGPGAGAGVPDPGGHRRADRDRAVSPTGGPGSAVRAAPAPPPPARRHLPGDEAARRRSARRRAAAGCPCRWHRSRCAARPMPDCAGCRR